MDIYLDDKNSLVYASTNLMNSTYYIYNGLDIDIVTIYKYYPGSILLDKGGNVWYHANNKRPSYGYHEYDGLDNNGLYQIRHEGDVKQMIVKRDTIFMLDNRGNIYRYLISNGVDRKFSFNVIDKWIANASSMFIDLYYSMLYIIDNNRRISRRNIGDNILTSEWEMYDDRQIFIKMFTGTSLSVIDENNVLWYNMNTDKLIKLDHNVENISDVCMFHKYIAILDIHGNIFSTVRGIGNYHFDATRDNRGPNAIRRLLPHPDNKCIRLYYDSEAFTILTDGKAYNLCYHWGLRDLPFRANLICESACC